ncbi:hypothetical protein SPI_04340 [Niveomyces insectorum RCEF 264]|uniref:Uncharacterized protein n=1 Tax=Niveomyces insectorum RCEF 264 TaxID=1081102 RepID=A0A167VMX6_9HYPO|nr:hypothetical protein SPI_04340 [Niveomyces insectorum RCEF 264]
MELHFTDEVLKKTKGKVIVLTAGAASHPRPRRDQFFERRLLLPHRLCVHARSGRGGSCGTGGGGGTGGSMDGSGTDNTGQAPPQKPRAHGVPRRHHRESGRARLRRVQARCRRPAAVVCAVRAGAVRRAGQRRVPVDDRHAHGRQPRGALGGGGPAAEHGRRRGAADPAAGGRADAQRQRGVHCGGPERGHGGGLRAHDAGVAGPRTRRGRAPPAGVCGAGGRLGRDGGELAGKVTRTAREKKGQEGKGRGSHYVVGDTAFGIFCAAMDRGPANG